MSVLFAALWDFALYSALCISVHLSLADLPVFLYCPDFGQRGKQLVSGATEDAGCFDSVLVGSHVVSCIELILAVIKIT